MPKPRKGEKRDKFISRCMGDSEAKTDFPDRDQRLAFCSSTFENNMENNVMRKELKLNQIVTLMSDLVERKRFKGQDHLVVPAVLIVEGVLNNMLYTAEELKKNPEAWNGVAIMNGHPTDDKGAFISANSPDVLVDALGIVFNARFDTKKSALIADLWLNVAKLKEHAPEVLQALEDKKMTELSTGLIVEVDAQDGDFKGNSFESIARNHCPDHLALLPDDIGACSIEDGCGCPRINLKMVYNQISHGDILQQLRAEIHAKLSLGDNDFVFIEEVFDDFAVFERTVSGGNGFKLLRQDFSITDDRVELSGEPFEVRAKRTFEKVENKDGGADAGEANEEETTGGPVMDKEKRVNALIKGPNGWTEDQRDFLTNAEDSIFDRIEDIAKVAAGNDPDGDGTESSSGSDGEGSDAGSDGDGSDGSDEDAGDDTSDEQNQEEKTPMTLNQHLDTMAPEVREVIERGLKLQAEEQDDLIKRIMANTQNTFTADELKGKKNDELAKLANLARVVNYGGRAVGDPIPTEDPNAIPATPAINWDKAANGKSAAANA